MYLSLVTEMRAFGILTNCECQHIIQGRESATIMPALHPPEHSRFNCCSLSASIQPAALQILAQLTHSHLHPVLSISSTLKPMHLSGQGKVKIGRSCGSKIHHDVYIPETFLSISWRTSCDLSQENNFWLCWGSWLFFCLCTNLHWVNSLWGPWKLTTSKSIHQFVP